MLLASAQRSAVDLRRQELEYYTLRYGALSSVSSVMVGFAYLGLIKTHNLLHPKEDHNDARELTDFGTALVLIYYVIMSSSMVIALYNFCVTSFLAICDTHLTLSPTPSMPTCPLPAPSTPTASLFLTTHSTATQMATVSH